MPADYPLRFEPLFRRYVWGGRRLGEVLGKAIGAGDDYAESWEVVDHGHDQSIVANGSLSGLTLHDLVVRNGKELFGRHYPQPQFPLLFKFLDAHHNLSVQVHPNDDQASRLDPPDLGKTEAWVVLHADPGSVVYAGLKRGFDRPAFAREVHRGTTELCLHRFEPKVGDCIFIPAGTVHALGAGLIIAEIQQASDTTFRLFDWNRVDSAAQPRPLHIEQALDVINYDSGPVTSQALSVTENVERLVDCDNFVLDRIQVESQAAVGGDDRFHLLVAVDGEVHLEQSNQRLSLEKAQAALLPAAAGEVHISNEGNPTTLLDIYLPYSFTTP